MIKLCMPFFWILAVSAACQTAMSFPRTILCRKNFSRHGVFSAQEQNAHSCQMEGKNVRPTAALKTLSRYSIFFIAINGSLYPRYNGIFIAMKILPLFSSIHNTLLFLWTSFLKMSSNVCRTIWKNNGKRLSEKNDSAGGLCFLKIIACQKSDILKKLCYFAFQIILTHKWIWTSHWLKFSQRSLPRCFGFALPSRQDYCWWQPW